MARFCSPDRPRVKEAVDDQRLDGGQVACVELEDSGAALNSGVALNTSCTLETKKTNDV